MSQYPKNTTITDLRVYPIKSCRGISLSSTTLTRQGLKYDRRFMFVDAQRKFITIRGKPEMTLIKTAITSGGSGEDELQITFPAVVRDDSGEKKADYDTAEHISVPLDPGTHWLSQHTDLIEAEIWGSNTDGYAFNDATVCNAIDKFFKAWDSESAVKLLMKGPTPRPCAGNGTEENLGRFESINFPDMLPVLVGSETSLAELNSRLEQGGDDKITIERFRPNIIVNSDNLHAWEEDEWRTLRVNPPKTYLSSLSSLTGIGSESIDMDVACRCLRCHVPNVDPDTGIPHKKQPWSLLYSYRRIDEGLKWKPAFGMLCCPRSEGNIEVGMEIEVREVMAAAGGKGKHVFDG